MVNSPAIPAALAVVLLVVLVAGGVYLYALWSLPPAERKRHVDIWRARSARRRARSERDARVSGAEAALQEARTVKRLAHLRGVDLFETHLDIAGRRRELDQWVTALVSERPTLGVEGSPGRARLSLAGLGWSHEVRCRADEDVELRRFAKMVETAIKNVDDNRATRRAVIRACQERLQREQKDDAALRFAEERLALLGADPVWARIVRR